MDRGSINYQGSYESGFAKGYHIIESEDFKKAIDAIEIDDSVNIFVESPQSYLQGTLTFEIKYKVKRNNVFEAQRIDTKIIPITLIKRDIEKKIITTTNEPPK